MVVAVRVVVGVLLLAHGLVHLLYLATDVPEFSIEQSWVLPPAWRRPVAAVLLTATTGAFIALALAVWGLPGLRALWPGLTITAAGVSAVLLVMFWNHRLVLGVVIDAVLVVVAVTLPSWAQALVGEAL